MKKRIFVSILVFLSLQFSTFAQTVDFEIAPSFVDISGHWGEEYIEDLRLRGLVNGKANSTFDPDTEITRAELTKIAISTFIPNINRQTPTEEIFSDVDIHDWSGPYINEAYNKEIINGYPNNLFKPNQSITRAEALKILLEASGIFEKCLEDTTNFSDVDNEEWYYPYINFTACKDIIELESEYFWPDEPITRVQTAKLAANIFQLKEKSQFESDAEIVLLNEEESKVFNEKYHLESENLWRKYINYSYGFSFYFPAKANLNSPDYYDTTILEMDGELILTTQNEMSKESLPFGSNVYFGYSDSQEDLDSIVQHHLGESCMADLSYSQTEEYNYIRFGMAPNIDEPLACHTGKSKGYYSPDSNVAVFYILANGGGRNFSLNSLPEHYGWDLFPFDLEFQDKRQVTIEELGISFEYPIKLGEIAVYVNENNCNWHTIQSEKDDKRTRLIILSMIACEDRGGAWYDGFKRINNLDKNEYCSEFSPESKKSQECILKQNANDIPYAVLKNSQKLFIEGWRAPYDLEANEYDFATDDYSYIFDHPWENIDALLISEYEFREDGIEITNELEMVAESINFLEEE